MSTTTQPEAQPHLIRALGRRDLVLLFVVAVFNLNVVPSIAANGGVTIWLWIISLALFFWPQGIAVIELAHRYPGEGGVYLWAKEVFGDFHGFLSLRIPRVRRDRCTGDPTYGRRIQRLDLRCIPIGRFARA